MTYIERLKVSAKFDTIDCDLNFQTVTYLERFKVVANNKYGGLRFKPAYLYMSVFENMFIATIVIL